MRLLFAYVVDGRIAHTDTFDTGLTPQQFADTLARLPKNPPHDGCTVRVWANPHADPHTNTPDAEATP